MRTASRILALSSLTLGPLLANGCSPAAPDVGPWASRAREAAAGGLRVDQLRVLSGPSPFDAGCPGAIGDSEKVTGGEIEPVITADPADPRIIVGAWQQDFGFGARSDLIGSSRDGGRTWERSSIPGLTVCTGGTADVASDPWVSAGVDGTVYFSATAGSLAFDPPHLGVVTSHTEDGGRTWSPPVAVTPLDPDVDTDAISASPALPGHAYVVWATWDHSFAFQRPSALLFSRTVDRGATWSPPVTIDAPAGAALDFSGRLVVVRDDGRGDRRERPGTLVVVFARVDLESDPVGQLRSARSRDEGRTWEPSVLIGSQPVQRFVDAESGLELPQAGFPTAAATADGTIYAGFEANALDAGGGTRGAIGVARSRDVGLTWAIATPGGAGAFAFHPSLAVDARGTVGLTFYDLRSDVPGDATISIDAWFASSGDGGASWEETHLAGPFDYRGAPFAANGHALGEYQGLTSLGGREFGAIFTLAEPQALDGSTDIFFARVRPGSERPHPESSLAAPTGTALPRRR